MRAPFDSDPASPVLLPQPRGRTRRAIRGAGWCAAGLLILVGLPACSRDRGPRYGTQSPMPQVREMDTASRLRIADAAEAGGNVEIAASLLAAAAAAEPNRADVQARLAGALARAGNLPQAEEVLRRAIERNPNDPALQLQLGRLRLRTGAGEEALGIFDRLIARQPNSADALEGRGLALDLLDRPAEAQQAYVAARALAPSDMRIAGNLGFSLLLEGRGREARDVLEPFAGRANMPQRMRTSLAIARAMTGDREGALAVLGPDVTRQDLDQLVAGLPGGRVAAASAQQGDAVPAQRAPRRNAGRASPDAEPAWRPYGETAAEPSPTVR